MHGETVKFTDLISKKAIIFLFLKKHIIYPQTESKWL